MNKAFNVEFERAKSLEPGELKQRAYDSVTKVFTTILEDEEVRQALLGPPPRARRRQGAHHGSGPGSSIARAQ